MMKLIESFPLIRLQLLSTLVCCTWLYIIWVFARSCNFNWPGFDHSWLGPLLAWNESAIPKHCRREILSLGWVILTDLQRRSL